MTHEVDEMSAAVHAASVPVLTQEERKAVERAAETLRFLQADYGQTQTEKDAYTLLGLLERLG